MHGVIPDQDLWHITHTGSDAPYRVLGAHPSERDPMSPVERRAAPVDPKAVRREGRDARNLIRNQNHSVVAFTEVHGSTQTFPVGQPLPVAIKNLHAVILAIANQEPLLTIDDHGMRGHELLRSGADFAEARAPLSLRGEFVDASIAISIRDEDGPIQRHGGARWMIEGLLPSRMMPVADAQDRLSREIEDDNLMSVAIGDPHAIPSINRDPMRIEDLARAVSADEGSIRFVNEHRRLSAAQDMHPPRRLHRDLANAGRQEIRRRAAEVALHGISPFAQGYSADVSAPGHRACSRYAANFGGNPEEAFGAGRLKLPRDALAVPSATSASACFTAATMGLTTGT